MTQGAPLLWLTHAAATLYLVGVIAVVQGVHYPLFARVGVEGFAAYAAEHGRRITRVVAVPMLVELGCAVALVLTPLPPGVPAWMAWAGLAAVVGVWLSTFLWQVPRHEVLRGGYDLKALRGLLATNLVRGVLWALRGVWALYLLARAMGPVEC